MNTDSTFEDLTIASLFGLSHNDSAELAAGLEGDSFRALADKAKALREPVAWRNVQAGLACAMAEALQTKLLAAWVSAWHTYNELKEKAERSRNAPSVAVTCTLEEHSIESSLHPYVKVLLGEKLIQRVDFDVALETEIDGLILNLKNGSIVSLQVGRCQWSGTISIQGTELLTRSLAELDLPGRIVLKNPISLFGES